MTPLPVAPNTSSRVFQRHWTWWFMVATLVIVAAVRLRLLNLPLERDEGEYAYAGQLLLQGIPPYELAYNMKFPGTYAAYAVIMALFGQTPAGIHFGVMCMTTLTALMLYWLGKKLLDSMAGITAASAYAVLAASPSTFGLAGHATHFCAFFATAGLCVLWKARQTERWPAALLAGLFFGLAILMKQPAALMALWAFVAFAIRCLRQPQKPLVKRLCPVVVLGAGMALPFGLCCLILWHAGVFGNFWFWTFDYACQYATVVPFALGLTFLWSNLWKVAANSLLLWLVAVSGLGLIWLDERLRQTRSWLLGFGLSTLAAICPDFYFRNHYFLLILPALAVLAGCAVSGMCRLLRQKTGASRFGDWPIWGYAMMVAVTVLLHGDIWFGQTRTQAARTIYGPDTFPEAEVVADFIRNHSTPDARVAVLGSEPEIYFLAHRHSATGYIYTYELMEPQPFARRMQDEMISQIETNAPEFVVFADNYLSWAREEKSDLEIFNWWESYQTNYTLVGLADVISATETRYVWGAADAARYGKLRTGGLEIYLRKTFDGSNTDSAF